MSLSSSAYANIASAIVATDSANAFAYLADGMNQDHWALGSMDRRALGSGLFVGTSRFDGGELFVRVLPRPELLIVDFETGPTRDSLTHSVEARVIPGAALGLPATGCLIMLTTWRGPDIDDAAWELTGHCFATEIQMIKGRLELGF